MAAVGGVMDDAGRGMAIPQRPVKGRKHALGPIMGDLELQRDLGEGLTRCTGEANGLSTELGRVGSTGSWHRPFLLGAFALQGLYRTRSSPHEPQNKWRTWRDSNPDTQFRRLVLKEVGAYSQQFVNSRV